MDYVVVVEGLRDIDLENAPARVKKFASQAVNHALRKTRTQAGRLMRQQIAFKARYLTGSEGRLQIVDFANPGNLEGKIKGRDRPTSLARFVRGSKAPGRKGVTVRVAKGVSKKMRPAFVLSLANGNVGLALRLREGERVDNKKVMLQAAFAKGGKKKSDSRLYLLYGPSVDQVFDTVRDDVSDDALNFMEDEFFRLSGALI